MTIKYYYKIGLFLLGGAVFLFQACTKPVDPLSFAKNRNEIIYPQKIDTVMALSGISKVQLKIPKPTDPQVQSIGIFWNLGADSLKASFGKSDTLTLNIDHVDQKLLSFDAYTYDQYGNKSIAYTSSVTVYGSEYLAQITNRTFDFIVNKADSNLVIINWDALNDTTAVGTEVLFKNISGRVDSVFIPVDTLTAHQVTVIPDVAKQPSIKIRTLYYPPNALDTFSTGYLKVSDELLLTISKPAGEGIQSDPYQVGSFGNLIWITQNSDSWDKYFVQTTDIDASGSKNPFFDGKGFIPIASGSKFTGNYDGGNYSISDLYINDESLKKAGLFSHVSGSNTAVKNVRLKDIDYNARKSVGGIAGVANDHATILNVSVSGTVSGHDYYIAGIAGKTANGATIKNSYNTANISSTAQNDFGGITGNCAGCIIENVYNTGEINASGSEQGGISGAVDGGTIKNSYNAGIVENSGGAIVGAVKNPGSNTLSNNYFLSGTAAKTDVGIEKSKEEMMKQATFEGFDFNSLWAIDEGSDYPYLRDNEQVPHPGMQ